ncbi:MAG: methyltransferase [Propionicimonas sp.]
MTSKTDAPSATEGRSRLAALCLALGADTVGTLTDQESLLLNGCQPPADFFIEQTRAAIAEGGDPLGEQYCSVVSSEARRPLGQTYTPAAIVETMINWATDHGVPTRVVDPGSGSGRYAVAAALAFPEARVVAADIDPLATLMTRATAAVAGVGDRVEVILGDYRGLVLPEVNGPTLFIGNPPYVRHHQIDPEWKTWLLKVAKSRGLSASALAGLHVHFFLATAEHARPGDYGAFITSSEWLDVNYGRLVRELLLQDFGALSIHVLDPETLPFAGTQVTGAITCFVVGDAPETVRMQQVTEVGELGRLAGGHEISRARLAEANRWSTFIRVTPKLPEGYIELGELVRVHRGAVTGANKVWVTQADVVDLPEQVLYRSVTRARELFAAGDRLSDANTLKVVIDLPVDLDVFDPDERRRITRFLRDAQRVAADQGYVARNRKRWYSVGLRESAPILATYMARRPPAFVRNDADVRHINIAHGLYPREPLPEQVLDRLATHLRSAVTLAQGRMYAGGLTKFEPREMERLPVPGLDALIQGV